MSVQMIRPSKLTVVPLVVLYHTVETLCHISIPHDSSGVMFHNYLHYQNLHEH